jgi:hypothetical protein
VAAPVPEIIDDCLCMIYLLVVENTNHIDCLVHDVLYLLLSFVLWFGLKLHSLP